MSRILLGAHDAAEMLAGLAIGGAAALWVAWRAEEAAPPLTGRVTLVAAFLALAVVTNGWHVGAEPGIRRMAAGRLPPRLHFVRHGRDEWLVL